VVEDLIEDAKSKDDVCDPLRRHRHRSRPAGCRRRYPRLPSGAGGFREHGDIYTRTCPKWRR
jgi:hypothetical protein